MAKPKKTKTQAKGLRITKAIVGAIKRLERDGRLTAEEVVSAAQDPKSPLHPCFTWDDSEAARRWRVEQARTLIRSIQVQIVTEDRVIRVRQYVRDPNATTKEQGYVPVADIETQEDKRAVLRTEIERVLHLLRHAEQLAAALGLEEAVEHVRGQVERLAAKVAAA